MELINKYYNKINFKNFKIVIAIVLYYNILKSYNQKCSKNISYRLIH